MTSGRIETVDEQGEERRESWSGIYGLYNNGTFPSGQFSIDNESLKGVF